MDHRFKPGDFLFYQLEAGFALMRILGIDWTESDIIWHVASYHDLFPDVSFVEAAITAPDSLALSIPHVALTNRAFESTQVAEIGHRALTDAEAALVDLWRNDPGRNVSDLSIRLLTGLR